MEEVVSNILIDNFGHSKISIIDMKESLNLPRASIFNLKKFRPLVLKYRIIDRLALKTVIIFKHVGNEDSLENLMKMVHELGTGKLVIIFLDDIPIASPSLSREIIDCQEYELGEFKIYLKRKKIKFEDFSNEELLQMTGSDIKLIEKILEQRTAIKKADIVEAVDQHKAEALIKTLNSCHIELLKAILTEYFKGSHETEEISKATVLDRNITCNALTQDPQIIMDDLIRFKVVSKNKNDKISFANSAMREALISFLTPQGSETNLE